MDDLLADFLTETSESLAELDVALVKLEQSPDDQATLSLIFRLVHTIKGTCGFLGLPRLEKVAHAGENVLGKMRDGVLAITPDTISPVMEAVDCIKAIVNSLSSSGNEPAGDDAALIVVLNETAEGRTPAGKPPIAAAAPPHIEPAAPPHVVTAAPPSAEPEVAAQPAPVAPVAVAPPPPPPPARAAAEAVPETSGEAVAGAQTIRVGVDVLEDLMTLVSELVLTRNQLLQLSRTQENSAFATPLQRLSHITSDLQEGVMKTRMQPIGNAWNKLPRLVRDLARDLDKKIDLVMLGQETELDRQVLELIKDPLTHMVRNSGDHGLERPAERRAAGKPEMGRITLNAFHEGGHIIIEIADDGRGLAVEMIRSKALSKGFATEAELATMSEMQLQRFIFRAGFSTAAAITAVSGRGVGMDVVKTNIEKIGGTIDLKSVAGRGTTFTIKIPLTLAIVSALIVEAAGERFAIPQISVVELVRAGAAGTETGIEHINGTPVLRLRERLLPLVNLNDLLRLGDAGGVPQGARQGGDAAGKTIVVAAVGASSLGIIVDRVFDTEEIVVKPVAPILRHITMFSGNTILGDGSVIMILDPNGIARATGIVGASDNRARDNGRVEVARSGEKTSMLLFRAGGETIRAVPLGLVARLEDVPRERIEFSSGSPVTQYRGKLMPLVGMEGATLSDKPTQPVLVFAERDRSMGLMVDEIVDVVEDQLKIELGAVGSGLLGTAVIAGKATEVIDTGYWLTQAWGDWFGHTSAASTRAARVLVVEDSDFFRQLIVPLLSACGYEVTAVDSPTRALALREQGVGFDAIVSDIEMPDMSGLAFAKKLRESGPWQNLPLIALSGSVSAGAELAGRDAGFSDYVAKFDRDALLSSLRQCLASAALA